MKNELTTLTHLRNLANRILEYFKANIIHTEFNVSDDEEGNVTITVTEKKGEA